jgi:anti-anti-sigma factor
VVGDRSSSTLAARRQFDDLAQTVTLWQPARRLIDMSGVTFMDSSGLGFLVGLARAQKDRGGTVALVDASEPVRLLLTASGDSDVFTANT